MHPGRNNDAPFPAHLFVVGRRGDRQVIHAVSGQAAAQQAQLSESRFRGVGHDLAEILLGHVYAIRGRKGGPRFNLPAECVINTRDWESFAMVILIGTSSERT